MSNIFQVRTRPNDIDMTQRFLDEGFVAIGWGDTGSLSGMSKDEIREQLERLGYTGQKLATTLGVVNCFIRSINEGNTILISDSDYAHIGFCSNYYYDENLHKRDVQWAAKVKKTDLNVEVQELLRNRTSCTKFKHPYYVAEFDRYIMLSDTVEIAEEMSDILGQYSDVAEKALKQLESIIDTPEVSKKIKTQVAIEILKFLKP